MVSGTQLHGAEISGPEAVTRLWQLANVPAGSRGHSAALPSGLVSYRGVPALMSEIGRRLAGTRSTLAWQPSDCLVLWGLG